MDFLVSIYSFHARLCVCDGNSKRAGRTQAAVTCRGDSILQLERCETADIVRRSVCKTPAAQRRGRSRFSRWTRIRAFRYGNHKSRFRPGRSRSGDHQSLRSRDIPPGKAALLSRGLGNLPVRRSAGRVGSGLFTLHSLAENRTDAPALAERRVERHAGADNDTRRSESEWSTGWWMVGRVCRRRNAARESAHCCRDRQPWYSDSRAVDELFRWSREARLQRRARNDRTSKHRDEEVARRSFRNSAAARRVPVRNRWLGVYSRPEVDRWRILRAESGNRYRGGD